MARRGQLQLHPRPHGVAELPEQEAKAGAAVGEGGGVHEEQHFADPRNSCQCNYCSCNGFDNPAARLFRFAVRPRAAVPVPARTRSEEHTSELQSLMRLSYAVFCLKKKRTSTKTTSQIDTILHNTSPHVQRTTT